MHPDVPPHKEEPAHHRMLLQHLDLEDMDGKANIPPPPFPST